MKLRSKFLYVMAAIVCLAGLAGCGSEKTAQMANELCFSADAVSELTISYDEETITFFEGSGNELIIREYMTDNKSRYYAAVEKGDSSIKISEGGKPFFKGGFSRYIEVYLPASYRGSLTVTTTNGDIDLSDMELSLSVLRIDSTSGTVDLKNAEAKAIHLSSTKGMLKAGYLKADKIKLETTSGNTVCENLEGDVTYTSTSGDAEIKSAVGCGSYKANNSGKLRVTYSEVTGPLYLFNKNDDIYLALPEDLEFEFTASSKNGSVLTNFQESVTSDGRTTKGTVGETPAVTVEAESGNGNIEVLR